MQRLSQSILLSQILFLACIGKGLWTTLHLLDKNAWRRTDNGDRRTKCWPLYLITI